MKKTNTTQQMIKYLLIFAGLVSLTFFNSCEKEEGEDVSDPIASFQVEFNPDNFFEAIFTNYSQNAETYSWDFGDGNTSTEKDPVHVYEAGGDFEVSLTATNSAGATSVYSETIEVKDPDVALMMLAGETSKTWKLYREGTSMGVGENAENARAWWALYNDGSRPCVYSHEFTFHRDGSYVFNDNGVFWGDEGVFSEDVVTTCFAAIPENMVGPEGQDLSAWLGNTHAFEYDAAQNQVTLSGNGAWMGLVKTGTSGEVFTPQTSVSFKVYIEEHDGYDLMNVVFDYAGVAYWDFTYAHYYDESMEPEIVEFKVDFDYSTEGRTVTFVNNSNDAVSYSWDFGDGNTSTEEHPIHTYDADGSYTVVLTGTSAGGESKEATKTITIDTSTLTEAPPTPTEPEENVISIYSHTYTDISGVNLDPDWGQATVTEEVEVEGQNVLKMAGLNYQGIGWEGNPQNVSGKTTLHVDVWCSVETEINISLIGGGENPVTITTQSGAWKSLDIPLSDYTVPNLEEVIQLKFDDAGTGSAPTIYVANIYFY